MRVRRFLISPILLTFVYALPIHFQIAQRLGVIVRKVKVYGDLKIPGFFDFFDTEGFSKKIDQNILFPAPFSKSPGRSKNAKERRKFILLF